MTLYKVDETHVIYHHTIFDNGQNINIARNAKDISPAYFSIHSQALGEIIFTNLYQSRGTIGIRLKAANQKLIIEKYAQKCDTKSHQLNKIFCGTSKRTQ